MPKYVLNKRITSVCVCACVCSACISCCTRWRGHLSRPRTRARLGFSLTGSRWITVCSSPLHGSFSPSHRLYCECLLHPYSLPPSSILILQFYPPFVVILHSCSHPPIVSTVPIFIQYSLIPNSLPSLCPSLSFSSYPDSLAFPFSSLIHHSHSHPYPRPLSSNFHPSPSFQPHPYASIPILKSIFRSHLHRPSLSSPSILTFSLPLYSTIFILHPYFHSSSSMLIFHP